MISENWIYSTLVQKAKALIDAGEIGTLSVAWGAQLERPRTGIVVMGPKGTIEFDTHFRNFYLSRNQQRTEQFDMRASRGFVEQMRHFIACLDGDTTPITSPSEQIGSLKVALGAYRSAVSGQFVRMDDVTE
jgi:predicted dehydrogenase